MKTPMSVKYQIDKILHEAEWTEEDWRDLHQAIENVKRKIAMRHYKPTPAGRCNLCGEEWHYNGAWRQDRFERQLQEFKDMHASCLPIVDGGCI